MHSVQIHLKIIVNIIIIASMLGRDEGYTVKYGLSPRAALALAYVVYLLYINGYGHITLNTTVLV